MVKCGFCHVTGHNRRSYTKVWSLREKGLSVRSDQTVEDFADQFSDDPDFEPEVSDPESAGSTRENVATPDPQHLGHDANSSAPSDNVLNVAADPSRLSPSPIFPFVGRTRGR